MHCASVVLVSSLLTLIICNFNKSNTPPWLFFTFLNNTNGTKSRKTSDMCIQTRSNTAQYPKKVRLQDFFQ